jgi:beta-glucosidase/6-phospho-beta-glucosidase/beta-galactosidase
MKRTILAGLIPMIIVTACAKKKDNLNFPEGFLWGTATAGFQSDMGCPTLPPSECNDPNSDWYQWVTDPSIIAEGLVSGEPVEHGPGHWELFDTDFNLSQSVLSNNGFRMSIEWSRIFPTSTEGVSGYDNLKSIANQSAIKHYHDVFASMRAHGITPLVTLNHYSLPLWIHNGVECHENIDTCSARGWLDRDRIVTEMAKYAGFVAQEFGGEVDLWATLNEPFAVIVAGYVMPSSDRTNPPGIKDLTMGKGVTVAFNMIEAHARMYDAVKEGDTADADGDGKNSMVGIVHNMAPFKPEDPGNDNDIKGAEDANYVYNLMFLNALIKGEYDSNIDGTPEEIREDLKNRLDFVGINYYTRVTVKGLGNSVNSSYQKLTFLPVSLWEDYPEGIYEMVKVATSYGVPVYITENGANDPNGDETGPKFLVNHLYWLLKAVNEGEDVRGYFWWTHTDNYEWNHGTSFKMGMFSFDPATKERKAKLNASVYSQIASQNKLPQELIDVYVDK